MAELVNQVGELRKTRAADAFAAASSKGSIVTLHIAELDKFIPPFVRLVKEQFQGQKHQYWLCGSIKDRFTASAKKHVVRLPIWFDIEKTTQQKVTDAVYEFFA